MNFLKLIRYKNLLMVLLTMVLTKYALIHSFITNSYLTNFEFSILTLSVLLITAGGYIINDIYDIEADKINKPSKVFIDKTISKKKAWKSYYLLTFLGLILGVNLIIKLNLLSIIGIYIFSIIGLFFYSFYLKKAFILGNILISILCALPILITYFFHLNYVSNNIFTSIFLDFTILAYSFFAFITTLIREIIKDIEDVDGDLKLKAKTSPILLGRKRTSTVAFIVSIVLFFILLILTQILIEENEFYFLCYTIIFLLFPLCYFLYKLWFSETKKDYSLLGNLMKLIMLMGILSMLLFKFQ